ncbi:MAG: peptidoglycan-binding protein, partial [Pseudomonadota bacterium]
MALTRRSGSRFETNIWPGFVDAMTALLLVLMFVLSIFMIIQFVLRDQVVEQERQLDDLTGQVARLAGALGLEQQRGDRLETQIGGLASDLQDAEAQAAAQASLIATLTDERDAGLAQIASFEEQVAG